MKTKINNTTLCIYCKSSISRPGGYLFQAHLRGGLIEIEGFFNLEMLMVSVLHKELEYRVEKLKCKNFWVMNPNFQLVNKPSRTSPREILWS